MKSVHRRFNPLTGEWILVSPHRTQRPWQGQSEATTTEQRPEYDANCYLCPGNKRANNSTNDRYKNTFVFVNDFSALKMDGENDAVNEKNLLIAETEKGFCKVICFSPRHDLTLADMDTESIKKVVDVWTAEYQLLGSMPEINHVQIFENKGAVMGCSNPHPHGQIWAQQSLPMEVQKEQQNQKQYFEKNKSTMLNDYLKIELDKNERVIDENASFVTLVPYWAVWPYETIIISKNDKSNLIELDRNEKIDFAVSIQNITSKYDKLFNVSFPYSSGIHQSPTNGEEHPEWTLHMHFYPPLLRSATVKKFMVGYEMLANPQRDITAESASEILKKL